MSEPPTQLVGVEYVGLTVALPSRATREPIGEAQDSQTFLCHRYLTSKKLDTSLRSPQDFAEWRLGGRALSLTSQMDMRAQQKKSAASAASGAAAPLYSYAQRQRRDESVWTLVQGILAPVQFLIFAVSLFLVIRFLVSGEGEQAANISILVKTAALYSIMVTGSIWEKVVFDEWLFAPAFFWEDVFSMVVLALHTAYVVMVYGGWGTVEERMYVALAAYVAYVINAGQFLYKLRLARLEAPAPPMVAA